MTVRNTSVGRRTQGIEDTPFIITDSYQSIFDNCLFSQPNALASIYIFNDAGVIDSRFSQIVVQTNIGWDLFDPNSKGGSSYVLDGIYYTQGVAGSITLSNSNVSGVPVTSSGFIAIKNARADVSIAKARIPARNFWLENIIGNVDLTNVNSDSGSFLYNIAGSITDPNNAANIVFSGNQLTIRPRYVYADNAAALSAGRIAGEIYRTATGDVKVVY